MVLLGKNISNVDINDINRLIENSVPESTVLDYKRELKLENDEDKREFLADISAFCNTEGGVIIFGVEEQKDSNNKNTGIPDKISPIENINGDQIIQKIENLLRDGLAPRLNKIETKIVHYNNGLILVIGIPKNHGLPKMLVFRSSSKFYKRRNSGKYQLDVHELNDAFLTTNKMNDTFNVFHRQRFHSLQNLEIIPNFERGRNFLFHCFPLENNTEKIELTDLVLLEQLERMLKTILLSNINCRHNLEGFLTYTTKDNNVISYSQFYRDGKIEFYTSSVFYNNTERENNTDLAGVRVEKAIDECISITEDIFTLFDIEKTYYLKCSIGNLTDSMIISSDRFSNLQHSKLIGKKIIELPGILVTPEHKDKSIKQLKNILWQCGGWHKSPNN